MGNCTECQKPICLGCQMLIAGKNVCQNCVSAIRKRVAGETASGAVLAQNAPPLSPHGYTPPAANSGVYQPYAPPQPMQSAPAYAEAMSAGHVLGGLGLGFLAGVVGLAAWIAFVYFAKWNFALIAIGIGWLIGIASVKGAGGRGGNVVAIISAILAFIFCGAGVLLFSIGDGAGGWIFGAICLIFGVRRAYVTPMAADNHW